MFTIHYPKNDRLEMARVIIYGAGTTGCKFANQLMEESECYIVGFVDKNLSGYKMMLPIYDITWLSQNKAKYDLVLIGIERWDVVEEVKRDLLELGIEEKIIIDEGYLIFDSETKEYIDIRDSSQLLRLMSCITRDSYFESGYLFLETYVVGHKEKYKSFFLELERVFYKSDQTMVKIFCAFFMCVTNNDNNTFFEKLCMFLKRVSLEYATWIVKLAYDVMPTRVMRKPDFASEKYYTTIRSLSKKLADYIYDSPISINSRKRNRVAFSFCKLLGVDYHMSRSIMNKVNWFVNHGNEVCVFVEDSIYKKEDFLLNEEDHSICSEFYNELKEIYDSRVEIKYATGTSLIERLKNHYNNIIEYEPYCVYVFDVNCGCVSEGLYNVIPTVLVPSTYYGVCNMGDCILSFDKDGYIRENAGWMSKTKSNPIIVEGIPTITPSKQEKRYSRKEKGFSEDDFIMVTVGRRLPYELSDEFADVVCEMLERCSRIKWVLIGTEELWVEGAKYLKAVDENRIRFVPYETDLMAFYEISDLYLNPNRKGGGISVVWAIDAELPVLMNAFNSDGQIYIGKENVIYGGREELMDKIITAATNGDYYNGLKEKTKQRKKQLQSEDALRVFFEPIEIANNSFCSRIMKK